MARAIAAGPDEQLLGQPSSSTPYLADIQGVTQSDALRILPEAVGHEGAVIRVAAPFALADSGQRWAVIADIPTRVAFAQVNAVTQSVLLIALVVAALAGAAAFLFSGQLTRPVTALTGVMNRMADDDLDVQVPYTKMGDEIGQMARATSVFLENARARKLHEAEKKQADADAKAREERRHAMNALADEFQATISDVARMSPNRPIFWRSTPRLKSRAPAKRAKASLSSPAK